MAKRKPELPFNDAQWRFAAVFLLAVPAFASPSTSFAQQNVSGAAGLNAPASPTVRGTRVLHACIKEAEQRIQRLQGRVPPLQREVSQWINQLAALKQPENRPTQNEPKPSGAKKVPFRLPRIREAKATETVAVVCEDSRVTVLDADAISDAVFKSAKSKENNSGSAGEHEEFVSVPIGHFDAKYAYLYIPGIVQTITTPKSRVELRGIVLKEIEAVRKRGHRGESVDRLNQYSSEISQLLRTRDPPQTLIQFVVYPDSYDTFREVRRRAWDKQFEVRWIPMISGDPLMIGGGRFRKD